MRLRHTSTWFAAILVLLLAAGSLLPVRADDDDDPETDTYVTNEVVVKLVQPSDLEPVATQFSLTLPPLGQFGTRPIYRLRIADGVAPPAKADQLKSDSRVIYAEPNYIAQTPEGRKRSSWVIGDGDDGRFAAQWAPEKIGLAAAHTRTRGSGVRVAVLDTGIDRTHPALRGKVDRGWDFVDNDDDPREVGVYGQDHAYGHGTHVAGLIALTAPDARILPVRVLDRAGEGNIWVLAEGLLYAANQGASVVNLSLGTRRETDLLEDVIGLLTCEDDDDDDDECIVPGGMGIVVVAAAGNNGDSTREYPAAEEVEGLIAVAATTRCDQLADFSTRGRWIRMAAPGDRILSSVPGGSYGTWSGTSMAAPLVAGTAALRRARFPSETAVRVALEIQRSGVALPLQGGLRRLDAAVATGAASAQSQRLEPCRVNMPLLRR